MRVKRGFRQTLEVAAFVLAVVCAPAGERAAHAGEWAGDLYGGLNFPHEEPDDGKVTFGGRVGYWFALFDVADLGLFADASLVNGEPDVDLEEFTAVPVSGLALMRFHLLDSKERPDGLLQPYFGAGPSYVWSEVEDGGYDDEDKTELGFDARGGLYWMVWRRVGFFAEYRFTYFSPSFDDRVKRGIRIEVDVDSKIHHGLLGITARFN
jgi:hypothetical protein